MPIELIHSELDDSTRKRLFRVMADSRRLGMTMTRAQIRSAYLDLEAIRDQFSRMLDMADGKDKFERT